MKTINKKILITINKKILLIHILAQISIRTQIIKKLNYYNKQNKKKINSRHVYFKKIKIKYNNKKKTI